MINFFVDNGRNSKLEIAADLYLNNISIVLVDGYTPQLGDEFTLWTCNRLAAAPVSINLPALPAGLYWDTRALSDATGVVRITDDATVGIQGVDNVSDTVCDVYTVAGVHVARVNMSGVDQMLKKLNLNAGTYIIRYMSAGKMTSRKVFVKHQM